MVNSNADVWLKQRGVYFYFPEKKISEDIDNYTTMIIVQGLNTLGVRCHSNVAYAGLVETPLQKAQNHLVVLDVTEANYSNVLMEAFAAFEAPWKLIHSRSDANSEMITPAGITCLMTHESRFMVFNQTRVPWAFGLSNKWLARIANETPFSARKPTLVRNFRPSPGQGVRDSLDFTLVPHLEKHFQIDRSIAVEGYANRLATSVGCLAYGGTYYGDLMKNAYFRDNVPAIKVLSKHRRLLRDPVISRWDSWRFWESLAAGAVTFHLDFEEYGFLLPEMPVRWKHYIPLNLADVKGTVAEFMDRRSEWEAIAHEGKKWALEHYTPVPTAERFLKLCQNLFGH